jgi:hypothetical protein
MRIYATYARIGAGTWRLTAVSAHSPERARSLAEREQRRPGSEIREAMLAVRAFETMAAVPWQLPTGAYGGATTESASPPA